MRRLWHLYFTVKHNFLGTDLPAVDALVRIIVRSQRGAFQGNSCKKATRTRVCQYFGAHGYVRICLGVTSYGSCSRRCVSAKLYLASEYGTSAPRIHYHQHEIGRLCTQLKTKAASFSAIIVGAPQGP